MNDIDQIAELALISDEEVSQLVSERTHAGIVAAITSTSATPSASTRASSRRASSRLASARRVRPRVPAARRWATAAPVVLGVAGAVLIASLVLRPGQHVGPISIGPGDAKAALAFTRHGQFIDVIVTNPYADKEKYDAEFKAHGLKITLRLVPSSPSLVDTDVFFGGTGNLSGIKVITAKGRCQTGGGGSDCPIGIRVPLNFRGTANFAFARAAKPGEHYEATASAFAPGEALHGLHIIGRRVSVALADMRTRQETVALYHYLVHRDIEKSARKVPLNWFVYNAILWSNGKVLLVVGKTRHQPAAPPPAPGTPVPTPSPTGR